MMNYEKEYKKLKADIEKAYLFAQSDSTKAVLEHILPELAESEDEKTRKEIISYLQLPHPQFVGERKQEKWIAWLEKQGNVDKASYEIAEKEKYDFVSGQFIECRKSFDEFKEDNSYWFEYVGNDTYIGRSDNILNKKFHITPRQLYHLFTQQHCPKEDNNMNEETNAPTAYGKYVDEYLNEASKHFFSEGEDKYSVADLFYAGVRCGKSWLEKQGHTDNIIEKAKTEKQRVLITETDGNANIDWDTRSLEDTRKLLEYGLQYIEKQVERNPTDKSELKFNVGEWVVNKFGYPWHIDSFDKKNYQVSDGKGNYNYFPIAKQDEMRLWSITDAKPGDVLFAENFDNIGGCVFLFKGLDSWKFDAEGDRAIATGYCCASITESGSADFGIQGPDCVEIKRVHPATKEQRDLLFQRMHEAGYIFDFEKKELQQIHVIDEKASPTYSEEDKEYNGDDYGIDSLYHAQRILEKTLGEVDGYQSDDGILEHKCAISAVKKLYEHKPTECIKFNNEFENQVSHLIASVLNGEHEYNESFVKYVTQSLLSYAKNELKPIEWSEEDDMMVHDILGLLPVKTRPEYNQRREDWLKSLKYRIQPQQKWTKADEQNLNVVLSYINDESIRRWLKDVIHKKYNKYAEWSEHDEIMKNHALQIINKYWNSLPDTDYDENEISESCYNWLKYIKERITWKPSKKQIIALRWVLNNIPYNRHKEEISGLLEQLNKL